MSQDVSATALADTDNIVIAASGDFSPAAGSYQFQITLASITKDQYAGGYFHIVNDGGDGIGEGIQYRIKSNSATGATTAGKVDIYLYDVKYHKEFFLDFIKPLFEISVDKGDSFNSFLQFSIISTIFDTTVLSCTINRKKEPIWLLLFLF